MGYRLLADAVMTLHFGFLGYVVLGGFLAWRWPWALLPHVVAAAWGLLIVLFPATVICPLTTWEDWARRAAGEQGLPPTGFIDHYLENVVYPERYTGLLQALAAVLVLVSWVGAWLRVRRRDRSRSADAGPHAAATHARHGPDTRSIRTDAGPTRPRRGSDAG